MGKSYRDTKGKFVDYRKPNKVKKKLKHKAKKIKQVDEVELNNF